MLSCLWRVVFLNNYVFFVKVLVSGAILPPAGRFSDKLRIFCKRLFENGCPRAPFGRPLGSLWPSWGPRAGSGARPGPGPAGPCASEKKPKKTSGFYRFFYSSDLRRESPGKDVSGPVEDLLNENPSHVALGKK